MTKDYWEVHEAEWQAEQEWLAYEREMAEQADAEPLPTDEEMEQMFLTYSAE